jgi:hypothetical protein
MSAPLTIRFATDHAGAKSGIQDLAASVVSNMVKVSDSLTVAANANGGYLNSVKTLATNVGKDISNVAGAGIKAANDSNLSAVAIGAAVGKAAVETKTASVAMTGAHAVMAAQAQFAYGVVRNEAAATARLIASSPAFIGAAVGVAGAVAAYMTVTAAVKQANAQIESFIKLGEQASAAGVSVEFWQRFSDGAKKAKIEVSEVENALKTAAKAVTPKFGEDDQVKKRLQEIFESGYAGSYQSKGLADYNAATTNEGRIRATITAMQEMKSLGMDLERIDVGARLFGPEFAERIRTGKVLVDELVAGLDKPRDDLVKEEEVRRAGEFRDRLDEAYKQIDDFLHVSTSLEASGRAVLDLWLGIAEAVAKGTVNAGNFYTKIQEMQDGLSKLLGLPVSLGNAFETIGAVAAGTAQILTSGAQDTIHGTRKLYDKPIGPELPPPAPNAITNPPAPPRRALNLFLDPPEKKAATGGSKGAETLDAVETFINGLEKTAAATKAEVEAFGKSNAEKAAAINLAKLKETADQKGIAVTDEQTAKVRAASEATAKYKDTLQNLEQAERQAAEASRFLWGGISDNIADAVLNGQTFANVISDLSKMTVRSGIQALLTGQGPLAGLIGTAPQASAGPNAVGGLAGLAQTFMSGFRASGGPVKKGQGYTVGELGQELFVPGEDGHIVPAGRGGGGAGGGAPVFNFIDQRPPGSPDLAPTTRRNASGGTDIVLRQAESGLGARGRRGQGPLAGQLNTAATRQG